jgi:DNA-binding PadR family transcriptional regulator
MTYAETIPMGGYGRRHRHRIHEFARRRHGGGDPFGPFGRGGWGKGENAFFGGRGRRAGRGDIRAAILALLTEESMHGYQIIRELGERTGGAWNPSPGSVYPTLQQLEDEELVQQQGSGTGRRVYELTDAGRDAAAALPSPTPWEQAAAEAHDEHGDLRSLVFQVLGAVRQVAMAGTPAQREKAQEVLRGTRRSLYGILAEEDVPGDVQDGTNI